MEQFVDMLESAGFSVINANDYQNMEIRDLNNDNELLRRSQYNEISDVFRGSNGREVIVFLSPFSNEKMISINFGDGLVLTQHQKIDTECEYQIQVTSNDGEKNVVLLNTFVTNPVTADTVGGMSVGLKDDEFEGMSLDIPSLHISQKCLGTKINCGNNQNFYDIENCNTELYINAIVDYFNNIEFIANNGNFQKGFKVLLSTIVNDIDKIFKSHRENIDEFIQYFDTLKSRTVEEYQDRINEYDSRIDRLKNLAQAQHRMKK